MSSRIEWTDETWNPVTGCTKISQGCKHCYAERMAKRLAGRAGYPQAPHQFDVTLHPNRLDAPLHWRKSRMIFVCSMSDLFHRDVPVEYIERVFDVISQAYWHTFQVLTKRPDRMARYFSEHASPHVNTWVGTSIENQAATERIPHLLRVPASMHFLSMEPLLGPVDLWGNSDKVDEMIDWVIVGGESGPGARPMQAEWVLDIRDQCQAAGVPFFFKQWGGVDKKKNGRLLDGVVWNEIPKGLTCG